MAWNGAGVFSRLYNWVNDANAAIPITASRMDGEDDGFATGLNNCLTKNGENAATANLPMGTFKHTGVGDATARAQYLTAGQQQDNGCIYGVASGTDTYTLTPSPAITAYAAGQEFIVKFTNANTTAATLNVSSSGAKDITKGVSTALVAGDIVAAQLYRCRYDGTRFVLVGRELNATATTSGVVELATDAETVTGADSTRATTPANLVAKMAAPGPIGGTTPAAIAGTTIAGTTITASTAFVSQGGITLGQTATVKSTADQVTTSSTLANATSLSFSVASGSYYHFRFVLRYEIAASDTSLKIAVTTPTFDTRDFFVSLFATYASNGCDGTAVTSGGSITSAAFLSATTALGAVVEGTIKPTASGTLQLQIASSVNTKSLTLHEGSCGFLTLL